MRTRITELFGIKYPILLAGMNWGTKPELVSAVSNAGGLGMLAAAAYNKEGLKEAIARIRSLTDKPFAVNLTLALPGAKELVETVLDARVPVINYALGRATEIIKTTHGYGGKVIATTAMVKHALYSERDGADAVVCTGYEAAAHSGNVGGVVLIPTMASKLKVPVIATGGFCDGRGLIAALALGAEGISMGSRFALTTECTVHEYYKQKLMTASEEDTIISIRFDGVNCRVLRTEKSEGIVRRRFPLIESLSQARRLKRDLNLSWWKAMHSTGKMVMAAGLVEIQKGLEEGDGENGLFLAGQGCGRLRDILPVAELMQRIVSEAEQIAEETRKKVLPQ